jgi:small-conductance mechanosensitive channel
LKRTNSFLVLVIAGYFGSLFLHLPDTARLWLGTAAIVAFIIQVAFWVDAVITSWIGTYKTKGADLRAARATTMRAVGYVVRVTVMSLLLLVALDNVPGIDVSALLASLGVAGIAVALALQTVLADLFASLAIAFDKPFRLGDFIIVGDFMGTVENVGIKTTRVRSLSGEEIIFSNSDLVSSRIRNYTQMEERRVVFGLGVTYDTSYDKLSRIPTIIQKIIEAQENTRFDRAHFASYGDFSLNFEIVYYVLSADYNTFMDIHQAVNLAIFSVFNEAGISFAFPTQTLHLEGNGRMTAERRPAPMSSTVQARENSGN